METVIGVIIAILCFMVLIIGHEFGHFMAGKAMGMQINEFSVGMGPLLLQKKGKETEYSVRAIPIGGYCAFESEDDESDNPRAFSNQPWWSKIVVLLAGPFMNIILGILVFACLYAYIGTTTTIIDKTAENRPAAIAGIQAGDEIIAVDGVSYDSWYDVQSAINSSKNDVINITVIRDKKQLSFDCDSYINEYGNKAIGIYSRITHSFIPAFKYGVDDAASVFVDIFAMLKGFKYGTTTVDDISGVVGVVAIVGETYKTGMINVIYIMAMISANLGYMNLLPIPALDGGRIFLTLLNKICGGRIPKKAEAVINAAGMIILLVLMALLMLKDTIGLFK